MLVMTISFDEGAFSDWADVQQLVHLKGEGNIRVACLDAGLTSGRPSIAIGLDLPDGTKVLAETSARLFCTAARAIMAKYPDLFRGH